MQEIKEKTVRGGAARISGYGARFVVRFGLLMVLARLLDPSDFGLVAMVVAVTGVFEIFATGGLSTASVQREKVSHEQLSTLFWCNVALGAVLMLLCFATAPLVSAIYDDPRTTFVIAAAAPAFLVNATGVQHLAVLQRGLRYGTLSIIEVASEVIVAIIAIGIALAGLGYWAVVATVIVGPMVITIGAWLTSGWLPGPPRKLSEISSMLHFGGAVTLAGLVIYISNNLQKILLGRFFGTDAVGLYGRAYELGEMPTRVMHNAIGLIAFSALARLQSTPQTLKTYFLRGYSLLNSITLPATVGFALFAEELVLVVLGDKWSGAVTILQFLAPTMLFFGIVNPLSWLLLSLGLHRRGLWLAFVLSPLVVCSYLVGLPYGPTGVALSSSIVLALWLVPHIVLCLRGTTISPWALLATIAQPAIATAAAGVVAVSVVELVLPSSSTIVRLLAGASTMLAVYSFILLFVMKQWQLYFDLWRTLRNAVRGPAVSASPS